MGNVQQFTETCVILWSMLKGCNLQTNNIWTLVIFRLKTKNKDVQRNTQVFGKYVEAERKSTTSESRLPAEPGVIVAENDKKLATKLHRHSLSHVHTHKTYMHTHANIHAHTQPTHNAHSSFGVQKSSVYLMYKNLH